MKPSASGFAKMPRPAVASASTGRSVWIATWRPSIGSEVIRTRVDARRFADYLPTVHDTDPRHHLLHSVIAENLERGRAGYTAIASRKRAISYRELAAAVVRGATE